MSKLSQIKNDLLNNKILDVSSHDADIVIQFLNIKLWINSMWRLEFDNEILIGSDKFYEYLSHPDYKDDYSEAILYLKKKLKDSLITDVDFTNFNEINLKLNNGFLLKTFQAYGIEAENFQLIKSEKRLLAYQNKVEEEDHHKFHNSFIKNKNGDSSF